MVLFFGQKRPKEINKFMAYIFDRLLNDFYQHLQKSNIAAAKHQMFKENFEETFP